MVLPCTQVLSPAEEEVVDGVCEVEQSEVPEMLALLGSGVFVEPLPDQICDCL